MQPHNGIVGDFGCHTANLMFRALHLEQLWQKPTNPGANQVVIRLQAWPSEVDVEGYPASLKVVMDIPARGALPAVKTTWYAKEKPPEDLMLGYQRGGWGDLLVGEKGSIYSDNPWNDTLSGQILNSKQASDLLHREYRQGWSL